MSALEDYNFFTFSIIAMIKLITFSRRSKMRAIAFFQFVLDSQVRHAGRSTKNKTEQIFIKVRKSIRLKTNPG